LHINFNVSWKIGEKRLETLTDFHLFDCLESNEKKIFHIKEVIIKRWPQMEGIVGSVYTLPGKGHVSLSNDAKHQKLSENLTKLEQSQIEMLEEKEEKSE